MGDPEAAARATALLARAVQNQAYVLAYIDAFMALGFAVIGALLLMLLLRDPQRISSKRPHGSDHIAHGDGAFFHP